MRTSAEVAAQSTALRLGGVACLLFSVACFDRGGSPTAPTPELRVESRIDCIGSTVSGTVSCAPSAPSTLEGDLPGGAARLGAASALHDIILGNQGGYVKLTSSSIVVGGGVFAFDVTLQNKLVQNIGTTTGANTLPTRVFFVSGPTVTSGTGTIDFSNGAGGFYYDGLGTFTASGQPYFQYTANLATNATSAAKTWRLRYDPTVTTFAFTLLVSTPVKFPIGYITGNPNVITLMPGEHSAPIGGTVRSPVGNIRGGAITYVSANPVVASVSAVGVVTAGTTNDTTSISLQSGSVPNYENSIVNVCATVPTIASGAVINGTIDSSDCISGFASIDNRPDVRYRSDMYRIALVAGQHIDVTMATGGVFAPYVSLVDPAGITEAHVTHAATAQLSVVAARSGVYIVEAGQNEYFSVAGPGAYTLSVTTVP